MPYIGNQPSESFTSFATQEFSTSATTSYTLDHAVTNENEIALFINNVRQQPGSGKAYTASGTTLTLSAATASTDTMYCVFLGRALQTVTPATNSITAAMVGNDLISGKTALGETPADTDEFLVSDAGTLKRVDFSHIKGGGKIGQVVSTTKTDTFSQSVSSAGDSNIVTGLTVDITPSATSSKILIFVNVSIGVNGSHGIGFKLFRDSTQIDLADSSSNRRQNSKGMVGNYGGISYNVNLSTNHLDSPSSTSQITYGIKTNHTSSSSKGMTVNSSYDDSDDNKLGRQASTITAMEVLA
jgi:hypothetical protein